ncbi:KTSC domain-containing protein [Ferruginibacter sp.]|nr:KTSC domain-containing protein [Ferruginibacter sp.]
MEMQSVSSSNLAAVGYDYDTATLRIEFLKSGLYEYYGVPADVYDGLFGASSKGTYFDQFIKKGGYTFSKL